GARRADKGGREGDRCGEGEGIRRDPQCRCRCRPLGYRKADGFGHRGGEARSGSRPRDGGAGCLMMPLLEDPEFWVVLAVLIFVIGVWKPARRAILGGLDARATRIRDELAGAQRLREEAERALAAYQQQQRQAAAEAEAILAHARDEAERVAAPAARNLEG